MEHVTIKDLYSSITIVIIVLRFIDSVACLCHMFICCAVLVKGCFSGKYVSLFPQCSL